MAIDGGISSVISLLGRAQYTCKASKKRSDECPLRDREEIIICVCKVCSRRFLLGDFNEENTIKCPNCSSKDIKKIIKDQSYF